MLAATTGPAAWPPWIWWLILAAVILLVELAHPRWILIWFALGAAGSSLASFLWPDLFGVQLIVFIFVSLGLMATARPITYHLLFKQHPHLPMNIDAVIGKQETCLTDIDNLQGRGLIRVYGSAWHAVSSRDDVKIKAGERVRIVDIRDLDLIVEPVDVTVRAESAASVTDNAS